MNVIALEAVPIIQAGVERRPNLLEAVPEEHDVGPRAVEAKVPRPILARDPVDS